MFLTNIKETLDTSWDVLFTRDSNEAKQKQKQKAYSFSSASLNTKLNEVNYKNSYLESVSGIILPMTRGKRKEQV